MNDIKWIYMINNRGSLVLIYKNTNQGAVEPNYSILSHFIFALQSVAGKFEEDEVKVIEIENENFFMIEEKLSSSFFILKSDNGVSPKKIYPILREIKNKFTERFSGNENLDLHQKQELFKSFKKEINEFTNF